MEGNIECYPVYSTSFEFNSVLFLISNGHTMTAAERFKDIFTEDKLVSELSWNFWVIWTTTSRFMALLSHVGTVAKQDIRNQAIGYISVVITFDLLIVRHWNFAKISNLESTLRM